MFAPDFSGIVPVVLLSSGRYKLVRATLNEEEWHA
jgi:hypothetical protein